MILLHGHTDAPSLHFPADYVLALPDTAAEGCRPPLALLLHDLGKSSEQWLYSVRPEYVVDSTGTALLIPEGRRSCFLNMAMGPAWGDYLQKDLLPAVKKQVCLSAAPPVVIGKGSGALGALQFATAMECFCALLDPDTVSPFIWDSAVWPKGKEWAGVFAGLQEHWKPACFARVQGTLIGEDEAIDRAVSVFGLGSWSRHPAAGLTLEEKLLLALRASISTPS